MLLVQQLLVLLTGRLMRRGLILLRARHRRVEHLDLVDLRVLLRPLLRGFNWAHDLLRLLAEVLGEGIELQQLGAAAFRAGPAAQALHLRVIMERIVLILVLALGDGATA